MKMCQKHWDQLKQAIKSKGVYDFVAASGQETLKQIVGELQGEKKTRKNFDPLLGAHNMIWSNAMSFARDVGANPLMMMTQNPEHPEWECPICCLNWLSAEHDRTCTEPTCPKTKGQTFDEWIETAATGAAEYVKTLPES